MLATKDLAAVLEHVSYKPGWSFEVWDDPFEGPKIKITAVGLPDAYGGEQRIDLGVKSFLPPFVDEDEFLSWLFWRLKRIEIHEAMEFFKVDGKIKWDPHAR